MVDYNALVEQSKGESLYDKIYQHTGEYPESFLEGHTFWVERGGFSNVYGDASLVIHLDSPVPISALFNRFTSFLRKKGVKHASQIIPANGYGKKSITCKSPDVFDEVIKVLKQEGMDEMVGETEVNMNSSIVRSILSIQEVIEDEVIDKRIQKVEVGSGYQDLYYVKLGDLKNVPIADIQKYIWGGNFNKESNILRFAPNPKLGLCFVSTNKKIIEGIIDFCDNNGNVDIETQRVFQDSLRESEYKAQDVDISDLLELIKNISTPPPLT